VCDSLARGRKTVPLLPQFTDPLVPRLGCPTRKNFRRGEVGRADNIFHVCVCVGACAGERSGPAEWCGGPGRYKKYVTGIGTEVVTGPFFALCVSVKRVWVWRVKGVEGEVGARCVCTRGGADAFPNKVGLRVWAVRGRLEIFLFLSGGEGG